MAGKFYLATGGEVNSACGENKPVFVGGIGEINYGKQYRQGNRVYDSNAVAMCLTAQPLGNAGGNSYLYAVEDETLPATLKYQRTEYAKQIRKDYEAGKIQERRCNMREYTLRDDGMCNTITTLTKDNYIAVDADQEHLDVCINDKGKIHKEPQITYGYAPTLVSEFHGSLPKVVEVKGCAMRGRYDPDGKVEQQIEIRDDELSNTITTVNKDALVVESPPPYHFRKYLEFYEKHGYIPEYFVPYDCKEVTDFASTLTTSPTHSTMVLIAEAKEEKQE